MTTTQTPAAPKRQTVKSELTAGQLKPSQPGLLLLGSFVISFVIFLLIWLAAGPQSSDGSLRLFEVNDGKLSVYFNWGGFMALGAIIYLVSIYFIARSVEGPRQATNRFVSGLLMTAFILAMIPLLSLIFTLIFRGTEGLFTTPFFTTDGLGRTGDRGALHAIVGTLLITLATSLLAVPIGIFTAIYLVEYGRGGWLSKSLNFFVDVMTGIPSIVAGLFAAALFLSGTRLWYWFRTSVLGQDATLDLTTLQIGIAGSIALLVLMIPTVVRSTEEMLRLVPMDLREASYALGVSKWRTIAKIVLPTALAGLVTGVLLAIARVIGETAPLMVAAGFATRMNWNLFDGVMSALPTFVYSQWKTGTGEGDLLAWAGALILMIIVVIFNVIGRLISHFFSPKGDR